MCCIHLLFSTLFTKNTILACIDCKCMHLLSPASNRSSSDQSVITQTICHFLDSFVTCLNFMIGLITVNFLDNAHNQVSPKCFRLFPHHLGHNASVPIHTFIPTHPLDITHSLIHPDNPWICYWMITNTCFGSVTGWIPKHALELLLDGYQP